MGGHLSSLVVANEIKRFTRRYYGSGPLHPSLFNLSPSGVCIASDVTTRAVGSYIKSIMTPPFHPYPMKRWDGIFSVALSFPSPGLRVTEHCVLWSSDFPPALLSLGIQEPATALSTFPLPRTFHYHYADIRYVRNYGKRWCPYLIKVDSAFEPLQT